MRVFSILIPAWLGATFCLASAVQGSEPSPLGEVALTPAYINQLAEELRTNHPALKAGAARVEAANHATKAVRTWEDPTLTVGGMVADEQMSADQGNLLYGFEQKLPLFGKSAAERQVASAEVEVQTARRDARFQLLRRDLARLLFQTAVESYAVAVDREDILWLDNLHATVEAQYRVGRSTQVELFQVENDRARRVSGLSTDTERLGHDQVSLNRLLGRPQNSGWPTLELPQPAPAVVFTPQLVDLALQYEPNTRVLRGETRQADAMAEQARRRKAPDVSLGFLGRNYAGDGSFRQGDIMLQFTVPWGNASRYRSDVLREQSLRRAAQLEVADAEQGVREEVHGLTVAISAARREALLYRDDIIPRTERALASARSAWESATGMFRDVLEQRRALVETRLMYARAVAEQYRMMSDLVLCCGLGDFESLRMIGVAVPPASLETKP